MRVLVTGATGFVGACLVRRLSASGHDTHIMVRRESNRWRISDLAGCITEHLCDLRDAGETEASVSSIRPEVICHLATYGGFATQKECRSIVEANLLGTMNLLRSCEKVGFRLFINTGSSSEYGTKDHPMREDDLPEPIGEYGITKVAATLFCRSEAMTKGLPIVTLRLFSPYGPWDDPKRLIPYAACCLLAGETPRLTSPISVRDYVYIDDVIDCYMSLVERKTTATTGIFNIGSGRQTSIGEAVKLLEDISGMDVKALWGERPAARHEPVVWVADIDKARKQLGFNPQVPLNEGLMRTVDWLRENLDLYRGAL